MDQFDEDIERFQYFHAYHGESARSDYFAKLVRAHFEGESRPVLDHLLEQERTASIPVPNIRQSPVFPYFMALLTRELNLDEDAAAWGKQVVSLNGDDFRCANDIATYLSLSGRNDLAQMQFEGLVRENSDQPGPRLNLLALTLNEGDGAGQARCISGFRKIVRDFLGQFDARQELDEVTFILFLDLFQMCLATGLGWLRGGGGNEPESASEVEAAIVSLFAALDAHPGAQRDKILYRVLGNFAFDSAPALRRFLSGRGEGKGTVRLMSACLDYTLFVSGSEEALARAAETDEGIFALLGLAFVHAEAGDLEAEYRCILGIIERAPELSRTYFHAAGNRFRADDLEAADDWARKGMELSHQSMVDMAQTAEENVAYLERAIAEDLPERSSEIDPWQDDSYTAEWWGKYKYQFENYTRRQDFSAFLNHLYVTKIGDIIAADDSVKCVINFGSYCGYFDHVLAGLHQDRTIFGFDRDERSIEMNRQNYSAPNLEFRSGEIEDLFQDTQRIGPSVITHIRTCTMLYPAGVRRFFEQCRDGGVAYILGIETTGYSFQLKGYPDFNDPDRSPVVPLGVMVDHNYPSLLADSGYEMVSSERLVYPIIAPIRENQEMFVPMYYIARRKPGAP